MTEFARGSSMSVHLKIRLTVLPINKTVLSEAGRPLLEVLRQAGIEIAAPCNGKGLCGKCKVRITGTAPQVEILHPHLSLDEIAIGTMLACEVKTQDEMVVTLPEDHTLDTRILEGDLIRQSRVAPVAVVEKINGQFQLRYQGQAPVSLSSWQGRFSPKGIAVDLGTTTLVVTLMDLTSGRELATASAINPQTRFGHDVMTRIQHASTPEGLKELTDTIADGINDLTAKVCHEVKAHPKEILDAVIGGNTTMLQLAAGIDPTSLGKVPFTVGMESGRSYSVAQFCLEINPQARVHIPPVAHAFVGSDISAGVLSIDFLNHHAPLLFMDLGTNGEMALIGNGRRIVTSTAAGPAFEGMGITHGMRAAAGAIEAVWANGNYFSLRTIDNAPARGICGSGIVDIMANLIRLGVVSPDGKLTNPSIIDLPKGPSSD